MKTDVIVVSSSGRQMEAALVQAEKAAAYKDLSSRDTLHMRLLTEEMMGLMRSLTGETEGSFWIEDEDTPNEFRLHLKVNTRMNSVKREGLLAVSSSGKNESAKGLMGRLRDFFDRGADEDIASFSSPLLLPGMYENASTPTLDWEWSMMEYETALTQQLKQNSGSAREAWDELEKSVVSHVADDIRVNIRGGNVEMTLIKKIGMA